MSQHINCRSVHAIRPAEWARLPTLWDTAVARVSVLISILVSSHRLARCRLFLSRRFPVQLIRLPLPGPVRRLESIEPFLKFWPFLFFASIRQDRSKTLFFFFPSNSRIQRIHKFRRKRKTKGSWPIQIRNKWATMSRDYPLVRT